MKTRILWIVFLVSILGFTGCGDEGGNSRGPGGPEISSVTANPGAVEVNGSSTLTCVASHPGGYPLEYIWVATTGAISGSGSSVTWLAPASAGSSTVICTVVDNSGKQDTAYVTIEVTENNPPDEDGNSGEPEGPKIASFTANPVTVEVNGSSTLTCVAIHPEGDSLMYIWNSTTGTISGSGSSVTWQAPASPGSSTVTCTVVDRSGRSDTAEVTIEATENNPPDEGGNGGGPEISSLTADPDDVEHFDTSTLTCVASHPDGDSLTYIWNSTTGDFTGGSGSSVTWQAPSGPSLSTVICTVVDSYGRSDTADVTIEVY